jgi:glycosyltransferase involved in cell wall biosynthesis
LPSERRPIRPEHPAQPPADLRGKKGKPRILVFVVAYNAEKTVQSVLSRIPNSLRQYDTEVLVIDDASQDGTFRAGESARARGTLPFRLTVLANPSNQGYGGNQKLGFLYALEQGFDVVALLHGDGQYAPEALPDLLEPVLSGAADAVLGSRMMTRLGALRGGMPLYKYVGNRILTAYQNLTLGARLSEFHSGYRVYSAQALRAIPFHLNSNDFHFDTEIIIQLLFARCRLAEVSIPTYYGDEICHVNGIQYAWNVVKATTVARLQKYSLIYRRNFDVASEHDRTSHYEPKLGYESSHSVAVSLIDERSTVVDLGCGPGHLCEPLKAKQCRVVGVDAATPPADRRFDDFIRHDLDEDRLPLDLNGVDYVLLLDVIEHLRSPERFVAQLHEATALTRRARIIVSTGNVGFVIPRLMHLLGQFNYGKRGILDLTHTRLFTFASLRRLFEESGFDVREVRGIPAPFALAVGNRKAAELALRVNRWLIRVWPSMFSYQILMVVTPRPTLQTLLGATLQHTGKLLAG